MTRRALRPIHVPAGSFGREDCLLVVRIDVSGDQEPGFALFF